MSADTHVVSLSIRFTVGAVTEQGHWSEAGGQTAIDRTVLLPIKFLVYLGTVGSAGLFLAARWAWPDTPGTRRFRCLYRWGAGILTLGLLGRFVVLAAEQAGGFSGISRSTIATVLGTPFGATLLVAAALSLVTLSRPPRGGHPWVSPRGSNDHRRHAGRAWRLDEHVAVAVCAHSPSCVRGDGLVGRIGHPRVRVADSTGAASLAPGGRRARRPGGDRRHRSGASPGETVGQRWSPPPTA